VLALLPGSRRSEVRYIASGFFKAAALVQKALPQTRIVVPAVPSLYEEVQRIAAEAGMQDRCLIVKGQSHDVLAACDCTLIASGTATLEAALYKRPMVISYSMHPWSWRLMKRKQLQPWVGLPNILCGDFVVPELLQDAATPEALAQAALGWLRASQDSPATIEALVERFTALHHELRRDTAELAAHAIQKSLPPPLLEQGCLPWHPPGLVAGVDEAGRGPLAGPVVAAAVILDDLKPIAGLNDSKKLTANRREVLYDEIRAKALCFCIAQASVQEIDEINILKATLLAMRRAVMGLRLKPVLVLVDGNQLPQIDVQAEAIVKGTRWCRPFRRLPSWPRSRATAGANAWMPSTRSTALPATRAMARPRICRPCAPMVRRQSTGAPLRPWPRCCRPARCAAARRSPCCARPGCRG
jgi:hypothetical protein